MAKVKIRNVSPLGDIWVRDQIVKAGEVFEVDADVAGRAPSAFRVVDNDAPDEDKPPAHLTRPVLDEDGNQTYDEQGRPVVEGYDPGAGLLTQTMNFERVSTNSSSSKADDKPADKS